MGRATCLPRSSVEFWGRHERTSRTVEWSVSEILDASCVVTRVVVFAAFLFWEWPLSLYIRYNFYLLTEEELSTLSNSICRRLHSVSNSPRIHVYFVVVSPLSAWSIHQRNHKTAETHYVSLVPKEVNFLESVALNESQTVALVPPIGENIKGNLTADGERQVQIEVFGAALLAKHLDECSADLVFLVV